MQAAHALARDVSAVRLKKDRISIPAAAWPSRVKMTRLQ